MQPSKTSNVKTASSKSKSKTSATDSRNTPQSNEPGGWTILALVALGALSNAAVSQKDELMKFAADHIPPAAMPVAYFVLFGMIFGSTFAAVLAYILNPRALFKRKPAAKSEPKEPEA